MREHRLGRHEGPGGLKPPVTTDHHNRALRDKRRGRHEHQIPIFISSFCPPGKIWMMPMDWDYFDLQTYAHPSAFGLEITAELSFDDKPRPGRITGL